MSSGVARQCSRNRCLARWTVRIPIVAADAEQVEQTRRETWSRARSEVFVPFNAQVRRGGRPVQASGRSPAVGPRWFQLRALTPEFPIYALTENVRSPNRPNPSR
jgi:hypothetical protein